jgi:putative tricarboxylic transport membrane protein
MDKGDRIFSFLFICISILMFFEARKIPNKTNLVFGPDFMPVVVSISLFLLSIVLLVKTFRKQYSINENNKINWKILIQHIAVLIILIISINLIGFILSLLWFIILYTMFFGKYNFLKSLLLAIVSTSLMYLLLVTVLRISLP